MGSFLVRGTAALLLLVGFSVTSVLAEDLKVPRQFRTIQLALDAARMGTFDWNMEHDTGAADAAFFLPELHVRDRALAWKVPSGSRRTNESPEGFSPTGKVQSPRPKTG